jgi:hypothetical protein
MPGTCHPRSTHRERARSSGAVRNVGVRRGRRNDPKARRLHCPGANCFRGADADYSCISRTQAGWIELVIVGILGFAWWRRRRR